MTIKIFVVDDTKNSADMVVSGINNYTTTIRDLTYEIEVISNGAYTYGEAKNKIGNNIKDYWIMFVDYNLSSTEKGTELLKLVDRSKWNAFRVLHSFTSQNLYENEHINFSDIRSRSKNENEIHKALKEFEEKVLKVFWEGNGNYGRGNDTDEIKTGILYKDVVYVESKGSDKREIYYRNNDSAICNKYDSDKATSLKEIISYGKSNNLCFIYLNPSIIINLRWVSNVEIISKLKFWGLRNGEVEVTFIRNNTALKKRFVITKKFSENIEEIDNLNKKLHTFFKV